VLWEGAGVEGRWWRVQGLGEVEQPLREVAGGLAVGEWGFGGVVRRLVIGGVQQREGFEEEGGAGGGGAAHKAGMGEQVACSAEGVCEGVIGVEWRLQAARSMEEGEGALGVFAGASEHGVAGGDGGEEEGDFCEIVVGARRQCASESQCAP
jgi:hypothetical protein